MTAQEQQQRRPRGRPEATSYAAIEQAAFKLFQERGFERTTLDAIATQVGVGRRTLSRYYQSKNDIPWGQFDLTLDGFRALLDATPNDRPLWQAVLDGVVRFNEFPTNADPSHEARMRLILETPTLQAHSVLRYRQWREVITDFVAARTGLDATATLPRVVGHASLALALTAYDEWLDDTTQSLPTLIGEAMTQLREFLA